MIWILPIVINIDGQIWVTPSLELYIEMGWHVFNCVVTRGKWRWRGESEDGVEICLKREREGQPTIKVGGVQVSPIRSGTWHIAVNPHIGVISRCICMRLGIEWWGSDERKWELCWKKVPIPSFLEPCVYIYIQIYREREIKKNEPTWGLEPQTSSLKGNHSTDWATKAL